jgi:hypothetical protein
MPFTMLDNMVLVTLAFSTVIIGVANTAKSGSILKMVLLLAASSITHKVVTMVIIMQLRCPTNLVMGYWEEVVAQTMSIACMIVGNI